MDVTHEQKFSPYTTKSFGGNSPRVEPMVLGSPSSPHSGSQNSSQYLPGFLLGEHTPGPSTVHSPLPGSRNGWQPNVTGAGGTPKFGGHPNVQSAQALTMSKKFTDRLEENATPSRSKDKLSAPPVSGLLDTNSSGSSHIHALNPNTSLLDTVESKFQVQLTPGLSSPLPSAQHNLSTAHLSHSTPAVVTGSLSSAMQTTSQTSLLSPPQVDPFYTQGYSKGAVGHILQQFNEYGAILDHVISNDGNWMHIHYKSKISAKKALSKNGKVIGNSMMVGVRQCIDQQIMNGEPQHQSADDNELSLHSVTPSVALKTLGTLYDPSAASKPETPIRPLTKAYHFDTPSDAPADKQKDGTWWKKAMEYAFGW
ncbi:nucleoporin NUP35-like isoform X2 [Watersipora subatra]|uniref:nucleoporin NUP35-like isoform X2 n=1 Tax=Watersipora subatra TaxID=2589382 RepID=UPI00355C0609